MELMTKRKALFICNAKFLYNSSPEGGVKFCTDEYVKLVKEQFDLIEFPVAYNQNLVYRFKKKLGLAVYEDYDTNSYSSKLKKVINEEGINHVFLNLTNTAPFAAVIKELVPITKIILCSHGNESGDFLHDIAGHNKFSGINNKIATYALGKMLLKEYDVRKYIDLVLTVSDVEINIEKWLGATNVYMVARTIEKYISSSIPVKGRVGFLSDLSHEPNFYGIKNLCEQLSKLSHHQISLHLVGSGKERAMLLEKEYSFIKYLGHLSNDQLKIEIDTWTFGLNPVFYYSRGVSTKLGKILGMGIPVITTDKGMRGYKWDEGKILVCQNEKEMAELIIENAKSEKFYLAYKEEVQKIQETSPSLSLMMREITMLLGADE